MSHAAEPPKFLPFGADPAPALPSAAPGEYGWFGPQDMYLFYEGSHLRLYDKLGSHPATVNGSMTSGDNDYFAVSVDPGRTLSATLTPPANADHDLYLYRAATGNAAASSTKGTGAVDSASITNTGTTTATYYVRVRYYSGAAAAYTLQISR